MGTNDLAKELGSRHRPDRLGMQAGLGLCLLAARAHGLVIVDGVFNAFKDEEGLRAECEQGRDMGFDGKTLIHPAQLDIANAAFAPTEAEIDLSRRQIEAFDAAIAEARPSPWWMVASWKTCTSKPPARPLRVRMRLPRWPGDGRLSAAR